MKSLIAILSLVATSAFAHGPHGHWRPAPYYSGGWNWVAPTVIGGVIGYEIARNQPPVVVQQPVPVYAPPPQPIGQNCSPWTEIRNPDGSVTVTRTCTQ